MKYKIVEWLGNFFVVGDYGKKGIAMCTNKENAEMVLYFILALLEYKESAKPDVTGGEKASDNNDMSAIDLKCVISEILLSSYVCDERKADTASAEIMEKVNQHRPSPVQQTQPVIPVHVAKKLICDWVGPCAMEEVSKLIDEHLKQQAGA